MIDLALPGIIVMFIVAVLVIRHQMANEVLPVEVPQTSHVYIMAAWELIELVGHYGLTRNGSVFALKAGGCEWGAFCATQDETSLYVYATKTWVGARDVQSVIKYFDTAAKKMDHHLIAVPVYVQEAAPQQPEYA